MEINRRLERPCQLVITRWPAISNVGNCGPLQPTKALVQQAENTASEHAASSILLPRLAALLPSYPDIKVEINTDYRMVDIVEQRFDAGVRLGEHLQKDMIAVRVGPDVRMAVVGAPSYFAKRQAPDKPQDLTAHDCINVRLPTHGGLLSWDFKKGARELNVRVEGQMTSTDFLKWSTRQSQGWDSRSCSRMLKTAHCRQEARSGAGRLVRGVSWVSPLLSKQEAAVSSLCARS